MKKRSIVFHFFLMFVACAILAGYIILDRMSTDSEPPVIKMDSTQLSLSVEDPESALLQGVTASDNVDGDVTDSLVIESVYGVTDGNRMMVSYAAFDSSGNVAKAEREVVYTDYHSPRFTLNGPFAFAYGRSFDVLTVIGADDVFEGNISNRVKATMLSGSRSITEEGIHEVQFRVTNSMGDNVQLVLPVEVYASNDYDAQLTLKEYLVYLPKGETFNRTSYLDRFEYLDMSVDMTRGVPSNMSVRYDGGVDVSTPGVYPVGYTVSCTFNERVYTGYSKLIIVVEE